MFSSTSERMDELGDEIEALKSQRDELQQALINAGHALCATAMDHYKKRWQDSVLVVNQIRRIEKLTGHHFN